MKLATDPVVVQQSVEVMEVNLEKEEEVKAGIFAIFLHFLFHFRTKIYPYNLAKFYSILIRFHYSENSTNSSGENPRYMLSSGSSEDLRSNDTLKRHGLLSPFNDLDGIPSELDFYYGIGKLLK